MERIEKLLSLVSKDEKLKLIYEWVKTNVIGLSEFKTLIKECE